MLSRAPGPSLGVGGPPPSTPLPTHSPLPAVFSASSVSNIDEEKQLHSTPHTQHDSVTQASFGAADQNRGKTHQSTHQAANLRQPQHPTINVPFGTSLFHAFDGLAALEAPILQDRCQATIVVTNPHVTRMMFRALSVTDCSVALSEALVTQITQYNNAHPASSPIQFYPHDPLSTLKGLILPKISSLHINKADKRVTLSLVFSSPETCQQARDLLDRIGIKSDSPRPTRPPPYSYGYISIPSHVTNEQIDSFLAEHGVPSLQIARVMYPAPSNHIPQNRCPFRCFKTQREALRKTPALPGTPSSSIPEWKFLDRTLMVCTHCHTATGHTANRCPAKDSKNKAAAEHKGRTHSCTRCTSFDHHEPQCPDKDSPGCPLCRTESSTVNNLPPHSIRSCTLFKQSITIVSAVEPKPTTVHQHKPTTKNAWRKPLQLKGPAPTTSPPTSAATDQIPTIQNNDVSTLNDLLKMIIQLQQQQQHQQHILADLVKQLPTMIQQAISQMRFAHSPPESGAIHVTPAISHNATPSTSTERQRPNTQPRRASQPNLATYVQRMQALPSGNQTTPTPTPTTTTTNTSVEKSPQTSPRRTPGYDTVQNTHRDQYVPLKVLDEKTVLNEDGNETIQFLIKWNTTHPDNTSWVNSDDSVIINSGLNLKWASQKNKLKQKQQRLQTKQTEQATIADNNCFSALADEQEEKHNHETAGKPGTEEEIRQHQEKPTSQTQVDLIFHHAPKTPSQNAPTSTPASRKRAHQSPTDKHAPASARDLRTSKRRTSAVAAEARNAAILHQEQNQDEDTTMNITNNQNEQ